MTYPVSTAQDGVFPGGSKRVTFSEPGCLVPQNFPEGLKNTTQHILNGRHYLRLAVKAEKNRSHQKTPSLDIENRKKAIQEIKQALLSLSEESPLHIRITYVAHAILASAYCGLSLAGFKEEYAYLLKNEEANDLYQRIHQLLECLEPALFT